MKRSIITIVVAFCVCLGIAHTQTTNDTMFHIRNIEFFQKPAGINMFSNIEQHPEGYEIKTLTPEYFDFLNPRMQALVEYSKFYMVGQ